MLNLYRRGVLFLGLTLCCLVSQATITASYADTKSADNATVHLSPADAANFQTGLESLSDQAHVTVVTEGSPLKTHLSVKAAPILVDGMAIEPAVAALAAAYDYDTQHVGGVFVLTKRYTNPQELPCVTLDECREAAASIVSLLDAFSPHFAESVYSTGPDGRKDAIVLFFKSLSPSQMAAAQSRTLRYDTLSPDQQKIVDSLFLFQFVQMQEDSVSQVSGYLDAANKGVVTLLDEQSYSGLFLALPKSAPVLDYITLLNNVALPGQQSPMVVMPVVSVPNDSAASPKTLGAVVAALSPIDGLPPVVETSISGKPVGAFGLKYAPPTEVMRALAVLYGLKKDTSSKGSLQLETPDVAAPSEIRQLNGALWSALPVSYARALHLQVGDDGKVSYSMATPSTVPSSAVPAPEAESFAASQAFQAEINSVTRIDELQQSAAAILLSTIQPQIKQFGRNARVPVSSLDADATRAVAVLLMRNFVATLQHGFSGQGKRSVLNCLDNMDQTIIYTDTNALAHVNGEAVPSFNLIGTDPYTNSQTGLGGVAYANY